MSDTTIRTAHDVTAALSQVDLLANDILADPERANLYVDPAAVIVELAARASHLRRRLDAVTSKYHDTTEELVEERRRCKGITHDRDVAEHWADRDRAQDAAVEFAYDLGLIPAETVAEALQP